MQGQRIIPLEWYARPAPEVAPDLLGCTLVRRFQNGDVFRSTIVETEAYGPGDPACHAYRGPTARNAVMFGSAGMTYVYFIYGMYHCLNVVTDDVGAGSAVLIRAVQLETLPPWIEERHAKQPHRVAAGPGKLCRALKIDRDLTAKPLSVDQAIWMELRTDQIQHSFDQRAGQIVQTTRIGLSQGKETPWRWYIQDCSAVSKR